MAREDHAAALAAPLPFVTLSDEDGTFAISPEAVAYLSQIKGPVAIVAIAGLYRTGKSYLLNLLLGRDRAEAMFNVGATVNACTKGIWIWGEPLGSTKSAEFKHLPPDATVIFMDTEGLGSTQRSQTQDTRIFALTLLLSSLFIYNSRGVIDSSAIEDLSLVVNLTKYIQTKASAQFALDDSEDDSATHASTLASFFPDFLWIVRDFTLQLEEDGQQVTARDYFESALKQQPPLTDEVVQKNHIRSLLSTFFPVRDCITMVRPLNDENLLRELIQQPYDSLRAEFRKQMDVLRKKLTTTLKPKKMMSKALSGPMLVALAENYVSAFNSGSSPVITSVWDRVVESQCDQALESAKSMFTESFEESYAAQARAVTANESERTPPLEESQLADIYKQSRELALAELMRNENAVSGQLIETYYLQLSEFMIDFAAKKYSANDAVSRVFNNDLLDSLTKRNDSGDSTQKASTSDSSGVDIVRSHLAAYKSRLEGICSSYKAQAKGPLQAQVLSEYLTQALTDELVQWTISVSRVFRDQASLLDEDVSSKQHELRVIEGKVRAAQDVLTQQKESYERALQTISERITEERAILREEIQNKQAEIERTHIQVERVAALHKEALGRLDAQIEDAKAERRRLEESSRVEEERRENERKEAKRQLLERERSFHEQEKGLMQGQQQYMQQVVELERQAGELDADQLREMFELEKSNRRELADIMQKHQDEQEELKEKTIQEIRELKSEQHEDMAAIHSEIEDKMALLSALREQLATREAMEAARKAKANQLFSGADECVLQ